jgi:hypothetical protein
MVDYVFNGVPTGGVSGPAIALDVSAGQLYYADTRTGGWQSIGGGSPTTSDFKLTTKTITAADFAAMALAPSTHFPVVVPAQGANTIIVPFTTSFSYIFGTAAYTVTAGSSLNLGYDFDSTITNYTTLTYVLQEGNMDGTVSNLIYPAFATGQTYGNVPGYWSDPQFGTNKPISLASTAAPHGVGDGTLDISVGYFVINV